MLLISGKPISAFSAHRRNIMRRFKGKVPVIAAVGFVIIVLAGGLFAQKPNEREVRDILRSLNSKIDDFRLGLTFQMRSSSAGRDEIDGVTADIGVLQNKVKVFEDNLNRRRENRDDIDDILSAALQVHSYIESSSQNRRVTSDWDAVRDLLDRLAGYYGVTPDWSGDAGFQNDPDGQDSDSPPPLRRAPGRDGLTGTYKIDDSASENPEEIIRTLSINASQRAELEAKLAAPDELAIDVRGGRVSLATSAQSPVTYNTDGSDASDRAGRRDNRIRASLRGEELSISDIEGDTDFTVTYQSIDNGRKLKVTRRMTTPYLNETVFVESIYNKMEAAAGLGITPAADENVGYSSSDPTDLPGRQPNPGIVRGRSGEFVIPNGTLITASLENEINTKISQNNDRFRMTVQSPVDYRGAIIEGYISGVGRSGRVKGTANVTFNFEKITMPDGQTYDFAGFLKGIRDQNGKDVKVDSEGVAKGDSQGNKTAKRTVGGAGLGAILGGIFGGASGAAIGATIGGSSGAGTAVLSGKEDLRLMPGSTITIESSSPIRSAGPREE